MVFDWTSQLCCHSVIAALDDTKSVGVTGSENTWKDTEIWISYHFYLSWNSVLLIFFPNILKSKKHP